MNAAVSLLEHVLPSTVHVRAEVPEAHASASILGTERMGTGTIVDPAGLVLTVNYVVIGAERIEIPLLDNRSYQAEIVGHDFASGLAVLRIPESGLNALPACDSHSLSLGQEVFIVASVGEGAVRVASGIVSHIGPFDANWEYVLERSIMTTAMNPGLGGGPLLDSQGRIVGIVSLNLQEIGRFSLAIPAEYFIAGRDALLAGRRPQNDARAWLGIFCYAMKDHVVVAGLLPGGPGERAGLKQGDVILAIDGQDIADRRQLYRHLWTHRPGEQVVLKVFRGQQPRLITIASGDAEEFFS